eukprot:s767_g14.t1
MLRSGLPCWGESAGGGTGSIVQLEDGNLLYAQRSCFGVLQLLPFLQRARRCLLPRLLAGSFANRPQLRKIAIAVILFKWQPVSVVNYPHAPRPDSMHVLLGSRTLRLNRFTCGEAGAAQNKRNTSGSQKTLNLETKPSPCPTEWTKCYCQWHAKGNTFVAEE